MLEEIVIETAIGLLVMYMAYRTGWKGEAGRGAVLFAGTGHRSAGPYGI